MKNRLHNFPKKIIDARLIFYALFPVMTILILTGCSLSAAEQAPSGFDKASHQKYTSISNPSDDLELVLLAKIKNISAKIKKNSTGKECDNKRYKYSKRTIDLHNVSTVEKTEHHIESLTLLKLKTVVILC